MRFVRSARGRVALVVLVAGLGIGIGLAATNSSSVSNRPTFPRPCPYMGNCAIFGEATTHGN